jgi:ferredoxin-thioredoxin reductase catalytic chain
VLLRPIEVGKPGEENWMDPDETASATLGYSQLERALRAYADDHGIQLNPHAPTLRREIEGLLDSLERYGYIYCPCRLADITGDLVKDKKLSCPCAYHLRETGSVGYCKCELFVSPKGDVPDLISTTIHRMQVQKRGGADWLELTFARAGRSKGEVKILVPPGYEVRDLEVVSQHPYKIEGKAIEDGVLFFFFGFEEQAKIHVHYSRIG